MSILVMSLVWTHGPEAPHQRLMMLAIADNANDRGVAWPSVATLAAKCSVQERAAQYTLQTLQREGWLAIEERPGRSNYYRVNMARMRDAVDCTPATNDGGAVDDTPGGATHDTPPVQPVAPEPSLNRHVEPSSVARRRRARIDYTPEFEEFWSAYPRKQGKQDAAREWERIMNLNIDRTAIVEAAHRLADDPNREDQFTPHPSTWLHRDGWLDGPLPARHNGKPTGNDIARGALALADRLDIATLRQIGSA